MMRKSYYHAGNDLATVVFITWRWSRAGVRYPELEWHECVAVKAQSGEAQASHPWIFASPVHNRSTPVDHGLAFDHQSTLLALQ